jgi:hypothetical protein
MALSDFQKHLKLASLLDVSGIGGTVGLEGI